MRQRRAIDRARWGMVSEEDIVSAPQPQQESIVEGNRDSCNILGQISRDCGEDAVAKTARFESSPAISPLPTMIATNKARQSRRTGRLWTYPRVLSRRTSQATATLSGVDASMHPSAVQAAGRKRGDGPVLYRYASRRSTLPHHDYLSGAGGN